MAAGIRLGGRVEVNGRGALVVQTFADVRAGELLLYEDAWRSLALAVNRGDAAALLGLTPDDEVRLAAAMIGTPHVHHRVTDSTNERAKELAAAGAPHGTLVTADEQTAGRGRQGRSWVAPPGRALLMSVVLRGRRAHAAGPAGRRRGGLPRVPARPDGIKWPNDVWVDGRKVAGILVEGRPQEGWAVLGIGLNVRDGATSSPTSCATPPRRCAPPGRTSATPRDALASCCRRWTRGWARPPDAVLAEWRERDALRGQRSAGPAAKASRPESATTGRCWSRRRRRRAGAARRRGAPGARLGGGDVDRLVQRGDLKQPADRLRGILRGDAATVAAGGPGGRDAARADRSSR